MHHDARILLDSLEPKKRDAVTLILAIAHIDDMPECYTREQQEIDVITAVAKAQKGGKLRMTLVAILALLHGRTWALAEERKRVLATARNHHHQRSSV